MPTSAASPTYESTGLWDKYPAVKNSGGHLVLTNSTSAFDAWDSMSLIFIYEWASGYWDWEENIKKGNGFIFGKRRREDHYNQGFRLATGDFSIKWNYPSESRTKILFFYLRRCCRKDDLACKWK